MLNKADNKMYLEESIKQCEKFIQAVKDDTEYHICFDIQALETVLQELERYQKLCIENLARSLNESINSKKTATNS